MRAVRYMRIGWFRDPERARCPPLAGLLAPIWERSHNGRRSKMGLGEVHVGAAIGA